MIAAVIACALLITGCGSQETTTGGYITVMEKGAKDKELWMVVTSNKETLKIYRNEPNAWNLIEEGKAYYCSYIAAGDRNTLLMIKHPGRNMHEKK